MLEWTRLKLWLDDMRPAPPGWTLARTYEEAIEILRERGPEITDVSLDHDLCPAHSDGDFSDGRTGCDVLEFLLESRLKPRIEFHTMSAAGLQRMTDLLEAFETQ
jgi:hypothetical protein